MHYYDLPAGIIRSMADEAVRCLAPEVYEKGRSYYHRNKVTWTRPSFGSRIYSAVSDGVTHTVIIHLDNFSNSTCTCAKKRLCEHIAAVFFYYYEPWLRDNGTLAKMPKPAGGKAPPPKPAAAKKAPPLPRPEGPLEQWLAYFGHLHTRLKEAKIRAVQPFWEDGGESFFLTRLYDGFIREAAAPAGGWPAFNQALYLFHANLFFMAGLEKQLKGKKPSSPDRAQIMSVESYQIAKIEQGFMEALELISSAGDRQDRAAFYEQAVEITRDCLFSQTAACFDWLLFYRLLLVNSFADPADEAARLEQLRKKPGAGKARYYAALSLAGLRLAERREEEALALLQELKEKSVEDLLFYLQYFYERKNWDKLLDWLRWLTPEIKEAKPVVFDYLCEFCLAAAGEDGAGPEFVRLVRSWLPRSLEFCADYYFDAGLTGEWAELVMTYRGYDWENIDKTVLRQLESGGPADLIPLYHQWAARLIEGKNRKSYREAVKVLKKLRALYHRQKMAAEWNNFISCLAARHRRMRALQEELAKGKLIRS